MKPLAWFALLAAATIVPAPACPASPLPPRELVTLPGYTIFDYVVCRTEGRRLIVEGEVTRPELRARALRLAARLAPAQSTVIVGRIHLLPVSPDDDRLRYLVAQAVYKYGPLEQYALDAHPPIHIVVKNRNVTLLGIVLNNGDRNVAFIRAARVPGVLSVTNALRVRSPE